MKKSLSVLLVAASGVATLGFAHAQMSTSTGATQPELRGAQHRMEKLPVEHTSENIANGVILTHTSTDAATVTKIQERAATQAERLSDRPGLTGVTSTVENIENGVKVTLTSTDADTVTKLQAGPQKGARPEMLQNVEVSKENLDNGVKITRTSTDADTVTKLQEMEAKMQEHRAEEENPRFEGVETTVTNIDNGVVTTLTSSNADTVTKLQSMSENPGKGLGRRGGKHRFGGMDKQTSEE